MVVVNGYRTHQPKSIGCDIIVDLPSLYQQYQIASMHQDNDDAPDIPEKDDDENKFVCPNCSQVFKQRSSLVRHMDNTCKNRIGPDLMIASPRKSPVPEILLKVDEELNSLLDNVESDYARWRLAQIMGVTQKTTYPILFNYHFPGSKASFLHNCCPTSDPHIAMFNVLIDAKTNHDIEHISMPKKLVVIDRNGSKVDASKWLAP